MKIICPQCHKTNPGKNDACRYCDTPFLQIKSRRKRKKMIILMVLVLAVLSYTAKRLVTWKLQWTKKIARIIPVDANNDGTDDLVVCYAPHKSEKRSLIRAVDLANDRVLWETRLFPLTAEPITQQQYINADNKVLVVMERHGNRIAAVDISNGTVLWKKKNRYEPWIYNTIYFYRDRVITFFRSGKGKLVVTAFNKQNGKIMWELPMKSNAYSFGLKVIYIAGNKLLMPARFHLYSIDLDRGNLHSWKNFKYNKIWKWRDRILLFNKGNRTLYTYDKTNDTIIPYRTKGEVFHIDSKRLTGFMGIHKDNMVYVEEIPQRIASGKYVRHNRVCARSLLNGRVLYQTDLPMHFTLPFILSVPPPNGSNAYFHKLPVRYVPLLLLNFQGKDSRKLSYHYRLEIFDLEKGSIKISGKELPTRHRMCEQVLYSSGHYIFFTRIEQSDDRDKREYLSILFNGVNGKLLKAHNLKYGADVSYYQPPYRHWQVRNNLLYGFSRNTARFWVIDITTGKTLRHNAGGLKLQDGKDMFRELFGITDI